MTTSGKIGKDLIQRDHTFKKQQKKAQALFKIIHH